ncbi:MAG: adenosine deaminase, partial [Actinobacteria bacterium]|nr:adenosine deaminase [Actinomycetota bacterium]MSZ85814.1 adenosine deaminase [Actinomycetota bacterium]
PIGKLGKLRFRITVNTDNRLMSQTSMTNEMQQLVDAFEWTFQDLQRVTINALKSAFIPFEERLAIIEEVIKPRFSAISAE